MLSNIALNHPTPTHWFITPESENIQPSEAEKLIIRALNGHQIEYYTEVSFMGMKYSTGAYARYDIWIPGINTAIEYDGEKYHCTEDQQQRDKLKTEFCKRNKIKLVRYNKYQYYTLGQEIAKLVLKSEKIVTNGHQVSKPKNKIKNKPKKGKKHKNAKSSQNKWQQVKEYRKQIEKPKPKKTQEEIRKLISQKIDTSKAIIPIIRKSQTNIKKPVSAIIKKLKTGGVKYGTGR